MLFTYTYAYAHRLLFRYWFIVIYSLNSNAWGGFTNIPHWLCSHTFEEYIIEKPVIYIFCNWSHTVEHLLTTFPVTVYAVNIRTFIFVEFVIGFLLLDSPVYVTERKLHKHMLFCHVIFLARDAVLAQYMLCPCVCPSVSITSWFSTKMVKHRIMLTVPHSSPGTLVF